MTTSAPPLMPAAELRSFVSAGVGNREFSPSGYREALEMARYQQQAWKRYVDALREKFAEREKALTKDGVPPPRFEVYASLNMGQPQPGQPDVLELAVQESAAVDEVVDEFFPG